MNRVENLKYQVELTDKLDRLMNTLRLMFKGRSDITVYSIHDSIIIEQCEE